MESGGQPMPPGAASVAVGIPSLLKAFRSGDASEADVDDRERELLERICRGDEQAFELLFERHKGYVHHLALKFMGDAGDAEDVTMEVFADKIWGGALAGFQGKAKFTSWIYPVTKHLCLNKLRKQRPLPGGLPGDTGASAALLAWLDAADPGPLPRDVVLSKELRAVLEPILEKLPLTQRAAFILKGIDGLTESEAAEEMGCSISQIRGYFDRARKALRQVVSVYLGVNQL